MSVKARCLNYTGCLLAYRGEVIELPQNAPLVCPECGKTVNVIQGNGGGVGKTLVILVVLAAIAAGLYFLAPKLRGFISRKPTTTEEETATPVPARPPSNTGGEPTPRVSIATPGAPIVTPSPPTSPAKLDLDINKLENQRVRDEVLKRIDAIPRITKVQRTSSTTACCARRAWGWSSPSPSPPAARGSRPMKSPR